MKPFSLTVCVAILLIECLGLPAAEQHFRPDVQTRGPVALALNSDGDRLFVANCRSGTLSVIDLRTRSIVAEWTVGRRLSDLKATPDGRFLLVLDEAANRLLVLPQSLDLASKTITPLASVDVSAAPVSLAMSADGQCCFVASLWTRRLTKVDLASLGVDGVVAPEPRCVAVIDLPFAPREQLLVDEGRRLIVADSFGGKLAIVNTAAGKLEAVRELPGHNIRGLALSPDSKMVLVSHQLLNGLAETTHNDVHWGILLGNILRWLPTKNLLSADAAILRDSHVHSPGDSSSPGGDPSQIAITADGTVVWALGGGGDVALGKEYDFGLRRVIVGRRPTAVVVAPDGVTAYVADTFGDAVGVINLKRDDAAIISLGPQPELTAAERGERWFYDARLSLDGWFSCHGCHTDGHSCGLLADTRGDGSFGASKRVLSLLGVHQTEPWAWNGSEKSLSDQIQKSVTVTMQGDKLTEEQVHDLVAYLETLAPPPSLPDARGTADSAAIARGNQVFISQGCNNCHEPPLYTTPSSYDVGLADKLGQRMFNPPSLRGVSQGGPFFHDGRAATLEDVFVRHRHQLKDPLSESELRDLLSFLQSL